MRGMRTLAGALLLGLALAAGGPARAQDADTPLDKALQQVEALLTSLRAKPDADARLVEKLEEIGANLRKEKEARGGAAATTAAPGRSGGEGGVSEWALGETKKSFTRGADLTEEEKAAADQIIVEFATDYSLAKTNEDEKSRKVIREHTENRISRTFPSKIANRLKDNLDGIIKFWEGRFGRGGR